MALSKFEEMLKTNDVYFFDALEFEEIIHHYLDNGNNSLAKKALSLALEQHPTSLDIKLINVEILVYDEKLDEATSLLKELKNLYPNNDEVYIQIANLYSKKDKHEEAIKYLKIAKKHTDDPADVSSLLGMEYLYLENFDEAIYQFKECLEFDIEDYAALYNVIYCYDMDSKHEEAIEFLEKYIDDNPYCEVAWHQLGRQLYVLKNYQKALVAFDYAVLIDESFIGGYIEKAKTLEKLKRYDEAIENYNITLGLDDPTAYVYLRIGECYKQKEKDDKAAHYYKKALHEDPLLDKGWMLLAVISSKQKNYEKSLHYINKAIALDETNIEYWRYNAEINLRLGQYKKAITAYEECIELGDSGVEVWITMVDVWILLQDYNSALNTLIRAKKQYHQFSDIEYRLGCLLFMIGKKKEAYLHLKSALTLDIDQYLIMQDIFPSVFEDKKVQKMIGEIL